MRLLLLAILALNLAAAGEALAPGRQRLKLEIDGVERTCSVQRPASVPATAALPLVLVLHGAGGSGEACLDKDGWAALAEAEGVLVAAPDGLPSDTRRAPDFKTNPRVWNSGQLRAASPRTRIDDVRFLLALVDHLAARAPVDAARIYAVGHSNGGGMCFALANAASARVAGIVPVAGYCWVEAPAPARAVPTLFIVGDQDPLVPLQGGKVRLPWGVVQDKGPIEDMLRGWAVGNGCPAKPEAMPAAAGLKTLQWGPGRDAAIVRWTSIAGQGHGYPGGQASGLPASLIGPTVTTLDATKEAWTFLKDLRRSP